MRTPRHARRCAVAMAISGLAVLVAGCGASTSTSGAPGSTGSAQPSGNPLAALTAGQIAAQAQADLRSASSVHVAGPVIDSGQTFVLDLTIGPRGCTGTMASPGKGSFRLLQIGKKLWFKGDTQFWKTSGGTSDPGLVTLLEGKYIEVSAAGSDLSSFATLCDPRQLASTFGGPVSGLAKGTTSVISGQTVLQLRDSGDSSKAYVTISAHPEFVRIDAGHDGHLDFTAYNAPLTLTPPPASEIIDGSKYGF
jgi:hypothetical protein